MDVNVVKPNKSDKRHDKKEPKKVEDRPKEHKPPQIAPGDGPVPESKPAQVFTASSFADLPLNNKLKEILAEKGFSTLTAV